MPAHDRGGLYDLDTPAPASPDSGEQHPQESIGATQVRPFRCGPLENGELVSEGQNLGFKLRPRLDTGANGREERHQNRGHGGHHIRPAVAKSQRDTAYRISDSHTHPGTWRTRLMEPTRGQRDP